MAQEDRVPYDYSIAQQARGGILATQVLVPPSNDDGDVIGMTKWVKARETFTFA